MFPSLTYYATPGLMTKPGERVGWVEARDPTRLRCSMTSGYEGEKQYEP